MPAKRKTAVAGLSVDELQKLVNKEFGEGTMRLGNDESLEIVRLPTGVLSVDWALGGGFARNRHTELFGPPSTGKTSLTYYWIAQTQRDGGLCAFLDVEDKYSAEWAEKCGVDTAKLILHRQDDGNTVIDLMETLIRSKLFGAIVLDSIAALLPKQEREQSMRDGGGYGTQQAKLMSAALRRLTAANENTACVFINQVREDVGGGMFVKKNVTSGGRAMAHYAAARLEMVRTETLKHKMAVTKADGNSSDVELPYGHRVLMRIQKEQTGGAHEGDQTTFVFNYELGGIDPVEDLLYVGLQMGYVKGGTSWCVAGYEDEKQRGRAAFLKWLRSNKAVAQDLEDMIYSGGSYGEE